MNENKMSSTLVHHTSVGCILFNYIGTHNVVLKMATDITENIRSKFFNLI